MPATSIELPSYIETLKAMLVVERDRSSEFERKLIRAGEKYRAMALRYLVRKSEQYSLRGRTATRATAKERAPGSCTLADSRISGVISTRPG